MNTYSILFISLGLAMDAFAVSIASGFTIHRLRVGHALRIAFFFGAFQAIMPVIGWLAGLSVQEYIASIDHWIAFGLLGFVGGRMIYEASIMGDDKDEKDPLNIYVLLMLSLATSIDALAVGLSLSFLNVAIALPAIVIGCVTFVLSFAGVYIGDRFGHFFESKIEVIGGIILIAIGVKILIEHLS